NTAILSPAGGNVGIGFAVPTNMARAVVDQLIEFGEVRRGRLGIQIQDVTPDLAAALDLEVDRGALVTLVEPGSAAAAAGVREGDVIIELDGAPVTGSSDLANKVGLVRAGTEVEIVLLRDGRRQTIQATVAGATGPATASAGTRESPIDRLRGAQFRNLDATHPRFGEIEGVLVASVAPGSPAARNGLRAGDIVTAVNRRSVRTTDELTRALEAAGSAIALNVVRDGGRLFLVIQ